MDINDYISKTQEFTPQATVGIPTIDRTAQADFGLDLARRAAQQSQQTPPEPVRMTPIVPVPN